MGVRMIVFEPLGILAENEAELLNQIPVKLLSFRNISENSNKDYSR